MPYTEANYENAATHPLPISRQCTILYLKELITMDDTILNVNTLPYPLLRRIHSEKVRIHEENGVIMLTPVKEPQIGAPPEGFVDDLNAHLGKPVIFGGWEGKIFMSDDFDAPLDDFEEYM